VLVSISLQTLLVASKEVAVPVNAEKNKYVYEQNGGQYHNMKIGDKSFARFEHFKYLEAAPTNQNCIHEEIKKSFKSENSWSHSVQNILFPVFYLQI
jgi:hypothetical protein